jgi:hypothetical protein
VEGRSPRNKTKKALGSKKITENTPTLEISWTFLKTKGKIIL